MNSNKYLMDSLREELNRLRSDLPNFHPFPNSVGIVQFKACCSGNSEDVLNNIKEVLEKVVSVRESVSWPVDDFWRSSLPAWFINACAAEMTKIEANRWLEKWRQLTPDEQTIQAKEQQWALADWLYWFSPGPDERQWRWAAAEILDKDHFKVAISVNAWPTAYGTLEWLFRAAGVSSIIVEE